MIIARLNSRNGCVLNIFIHLVVVYITAGAAVIIINRSNRGRSRGVTGGTRKVCFCIDQTGFMLLIMLIVKKMMKIVGRSSVRKGDGASCGSGDRIGSVTDAVGRSCVSGGKICDCGGKSRSRGWKQDWIDVGVGSGVARDIER